MFTGIVECTGTVTAARSAAAAMRLTIAPGFPTDQMKPGDSVAVNGACLTVVSVTPTGLEMDVIPETLSRTTLGSLRPPMKVNLERSLRMGDRIEGHWVQGHIDFVARIMRRVAGSGEWSLWLELTEELRPYVVRKGSVAIDGVSLTVADLQSDQFSVALIPTTLDRTTLMDRQVGDRVNVETDLVVRTIVHNLSTFVSGGGLHEKLRAGGFLEER